MLSASGTGRPSAPRVLAVLGSLLELAACDRQGQPEQAGSSPLIRITAYFPFLLAAT
jgi:hypothetical protein